MSYARRALEVAQKLMAADPENEQNQRDLSLAYELLGQSLLKSGELVEARRMHQEALQLREQLAPSTVPLERRRIRRQEVAWLPAR